MKPHMHYMFEKELTHGNHVSYHFIYDYFDTVSPTNSKLYLLEEKLRDSITYQGMDLRGYGNAITPANTTSPDEDVFHIGSYYKPIGSEIQTFFKIPVDFQVLYFSKKIANATKESSFKCGYMPEYFFNEMGFSKWKDEAYHLVKLFEENAHHIIIASHFNADGSVNEKELNVEIIPNYSVENYYWLKQNLLNTFDLRKDVFDLYDKKFEGYYLEKFHFHAKIKFTDEKTTVKFYRTWPFNPYTGEYMGRFANLKPEEIV